MNDYQRQQLNRLQGWFNDLEGFIGTLPSLLFQADDTGDYSALKKQLQRLAWERRENWKQFHNHSIRALSTQVFENDCLWGKVGELLDFFKTKADTGLVMDWTAGGLKGIDFQTPSGWEDTKWSLHKWTDFPIELKSRGNQSHHWNYVENGQPVFLRFINAEGCWRVQLTPEMKENPSRNYGGVTTIYDCPKEKFEKVWEW